MYLRSTKRRNQDGTEVEYFQLAHNVRNPRTGKPLAQIIHNFGRADVEEAVFFRTADLFNLEVDLIFYDTTTAAFAMQAMAKYTAWLDSQMQGVDQNVDQTSSHPPK